jgi:hypothetical protein
MNLAPELSILLVADSLAEVIPTLRCFGECSDKVRLEVVIVSRHNTGLSAERVRAEGFKHVQTLSIEGDSFAHARLNVRAATAPYVVFALPNATHLATLTSYGLHEIPGTGVSSGLPWSTPAPRTR